MPEPDYQEILTATLRKIGRNLLNYQLVESHWKYHIKASNVRVCAGKVEYPNSKGRSIPMGWLANDHTESLFAPIPEVDEESDDYEEITMRFTFTFNKDKEWHKARRKQLNLLIGERNTLVHGLLGRFDRSNTESCLTLCKQLDEENERIVAELQYLKAISTGIMAAIKDSLSSDEYIDQIISSMKAHEDKST